MGLEGAPGTGFLRLARDLSDSGEAELEGQEQVWYRMLPAACPCVPWPAQNFRGGFSRTTLGQAQSEYAPAWPGPPNPWPSMTESGDDPGLILKKVQTPAQCPLLASAIAAGHKPPERDSNPRRKRHRFSVRIHRARIGSQRNSHGTLTGVHSIFWRVYAQHPRHGNTKTGFTDLPLNASATALLRSAKGYWVTRRSRGRSLASKSFTRSGMNSCGCPSPSRTKEIR